MISIKAYDETRDFEHIIRSCEEEGWIKFYTTKKEEFRRALSASESYVAYDGEEYCGFTRCITDGHFTIFCCEIIVDPEFRRRGVGGLLLKTVNDQYPVLWYGIDRTASFRIESDGVLVDLPACSYCYSIDGHVEGERNIPSSECVTLLSWI